MKRNKSQLSTLHSQLIPPGYKQTEVGVIPEDWSTCPVGDLAICFSGGTPSTSNPSYYGGRIPWITSSDLNQRRVKHVPGRITQLGLVNSAAKPVDKGVLLVALYGATAGVCAVTEIAATINQAVLAVLPRHVDTEYLFQFLTLNKDRYIHTYTQGGQPNLSGEIVKSFKIAVPPTSTEQHAIATALSDADALLDGLDRLIAKKRDIKQAAMQALLSAPPTKEMENGEWKMENEDSTGNSQLSTLNSPFIRLPGFEGEWEVKRLGDCGIFLKGSGIKKDEAQNGDIPSIRYGELYTKHHEYIKTFYSFITSDIAKTAERLKRGDILFAGSGETKEEIGKCAAFLGEFEAYAGGDIVIYRPEGLDSLFLGFCLNVPEANRQKASKGQGDAVVHISASSLADLVVSLPADPDEQTAIAAVLSDMDAEIAALELRRAKTKDIKQAMMQELLTGKTRLVNVEISA